MPYFKKILFLIFLSLVLSLTLNATPALAADSCSNIEIDIKTDPASPIPTGLKSLSLKLVNRQTQQMAIGSYRLSFCKVKNSIACIDRLYSQATKIDKPEPVTLVIDNLALLAEGDYSAVLDRNENILCDSVTYQIGYAWEQCKMTIQPTNPSNVDPIRLTLSNVPQGTHTIRWRDAKGGVVNYSSGEAGNVLIDSTGHGVLEIPSIKFVGEVMFDIQNTTSSKGRNWCKAHVTIRDSGGAAPNPLPTPGGPDEQTSGCTGAICTSAAGKACEGGQAGVLTAIGCIPTEPTAFVQSFIKVAIGAGGGIALLLMIYGAFQMITSSGNPDGVKKGHEQITSAVIGLLFIIFAVMLLKIIGVDILQIPGFKP